MESFVQKHAAKVIGVLSGFDRLVFRGTIRQIAHVSGMHSYLAIIRLLLKDFGKHALRMSEQLKKAVYGRVEKLGRPVIYLPSGRESKEKRARRIAEDEGISEGTICMLTCVEPCQAFEIRRCREHKKLELVVRQRKCLHLYHYCMHPQLGLMHSRIQSWFPFNIQVCLNGRQWLSRQMDQDGIGYLRRENCFPWVEDIQAAQRLMDTQLKTHWPDLLNGLARQLNPAHDIMFDAFRAPYYWTTFQSEWATDVMFKDADSLAQIYPRLVQHGISHLASPDVMRFLGRKVPPDGMVHPSFQGEVVSDLKRRPEGVRIKHRVNSNSIKAYDKQGSVLRVETTINQPRDFKVFRPKEGGDVADKQWLRLRKGVADLYRQAEISQAANNRYLTALAAVPHSPSLADLVDCLGRYRIWKKQRVRALNPLAPDDVSLLQSIVRGEFTINGFRNRDLAAVLFSETPRNPKDKRRRCSWVTRRIRLLRAHRLIQKVPKTYRYMLTNEGRIAVTALLAARDASPEHLTESRGNKVESFHKKQTKDP